MGPTREETSVKYSESDSEPHPLAESAGVFSPDDPLVQEWIQIIAENRRQADNNPNLP